MRVLAGHLTARYSAPMDKNSVPYGLCTTPPARANPQSDISARPNNSLICALTVLFVWLLLAFCPALAQQPGSVAISDVQAAQLLIVNGRYDYAKKLLEHDLAARPDDSELLFLLATVDLGQKDYDGAIALFRR